MCRQTAPPSLPATQRGAGKQHSSPNLTTIKSCLPAQAYRAALAVRLRRWSGRRPGAAGWLGIEAHSHAHRCPPPPSAYIQCTSHATCHGCPSCWLVLLLHLQLQYTLRRRGPARPARHDSTQNSSLHARTPKARQARAPSSLERRPSAGLTAAQVVVCDNPLSLPTAVPQGQ